MCVAPPDAGPNHTPSMSDASSLRNVGIGAVVPPGKGTLICDGAVIPSSRAIYSDGGGRERIGLNLA